MGFINRLLLALGYITTLYVSGSSRSLTVHGGSDLEKVGFETALDHSAA